MTPQQRAKLERMSRLGQTVTHKRKGGAGREVVGTVVDEVYIIVSDYKHMIQQIRFPDHARWDGSEFAYRVGYYTYDASGKHIKWGQYTSVLTESQYRELLAKARAKGWDIF